ncbi:histone-lysine N-methyltransferase SETDB1-like protein [Aphelenchoides avenae]|nr:histone-lysine N-methyltransferase SETDB1-like protein [Aphelenchus avenae]
MVYTLKIPIAVGHSSVDALRNEFVRLRKELGKLLSREEVFDIGEQEMKIIQSFDEKTLVRQVQSLEEKVAAQKRFLQLYEEMSQESSTHPTPVAAAAMNADSSSTAASTDDPAVDLLVEDLSRLRASGLPPAQEFILRKMFDEAKRQSAWGTAQLVKCGTSSAISEVVDIHGFAVRDKEASADAPIADSVIVKLPKGFFDSADQPSTSACKPSEPLKTCLAVSLPLEGVMELLSLTSEPRHYTIFAAEGMKPHFTTFPSPWYIPAGIRLEERHVQTTDVLLKPPYVHRVFTFSKGFDPRRQVLASDLANTENFIDFTDGQVWPPVVIRKRPFNLPLPTVYGIYEEANNFGGCCQGYCKERQEPQGCECTDGCLDETTCACRQKTLKRHANECPKSLRPKNVVCEFGTLTERIPTGIYACNHNCRCRNTPASSILPSFPACTNMIVRRGSAIPKEMWRTKEMGWSVRTLVDIPKGAFVVTTYHANLNFPLLGRKRPFVVDGKFYGNVAAFINHSCEPNLFAQHVFTDVHHDRLPEIALFAARDITAGEDLSWDYRYESQKRVPCKCGSKNCRGWLM